MDPKIASLNARGLGNNTKLIGCDQESSQYICYKRSIVRRTLQIYGPVSGGSKVFFSCCTTTKRAPVFSSTTISVWRFFNGRFILCDMKANDKPLTLANIYAPNEDDPLFFITFSTICQASAAQTS